MVEGQCRYGEAEKLQLEGKASKCIKNCWFGILKGK